MRSEEKPKAIAPSKLGGWYGTPFRSPFPNIPFAEFRLKANRMLRILWPVGGVTIGVSVSSGHQFSDGAIHLVLTFSNEPRGNWEVGKNEVASEERDVQLGVRDGNTNVCVTTVIQSDKRHARFIDGF